MKITAVDVIPYRIPNREVHKIATLTLSAVDNVIVRIHTDKGVEGIGECVTEAKWNSTVMEAHAVLLEKYLAPAIVGADPFRHVGRQDLTATVDLAAVRIAAARAGLDPLGETTQAELIATLGTGDLTQAYLRREGAGLPDALELRSALARLLDPRGMGAFRVLAFGRALPPGTRLAGLERLVPPRR